MMGAFHSFEGPCQSCRDALLALGRSPELFLCMARPIARPFCWGTNFPSQGPTNLSLKQLLILLLFSTHGLCAQTTVGTNARHAGSRALALLAWERAAGQGTEQRQHLQVLLYPLPGCMEVVLISSCWDPVTGHIGMVQSCIRGSSNLVLVILAALHSVPSSTHPAHAQTLAEHLARFGVLNEAIGTDIE